MNYCKANDIHTVIIGDITNIRRNKNLGKVTNQKLHAPQVTKEYAKKCNRTNRGLYKVFYLKQSPKFLEISNALCYIEYKERHLLEQMPFSSDSIHSKSGCSQARCYCTLTSAALPVGRQVRHFYFLLLFLLLSRKVRNAITNVPKDISKPIIPMNIKMISAHVITTHLPSYVFRQAGH